jgi:hypothetical protein
MYKVIVNNYIIDLLEQIQYIRFLPTGHIAFTDKTSAHGFVGSDNITVYSLAPITMLDYKIAELVEISDEEYFKLKKLLDKGAQISSDESELIKMRNEVVNKMSILCKQNIIAGCTLDLSKGKDFHFNLTVEDQLNLMRIEQQINNGEQFFIYHATAKPCEVFSKDDMAKIIEQTKKHTLFHTTYFNTLKQYINNQTDIDVIKNIKYGIDISDTIDDPIIKSILKQGGSSI